MDFKNILVATDFSNEAYAALFYATQILASEPCIFHIINSYDDLSSSTEKQIALFIGKNELKLMRIASEEQLTETVHRIIRDTGNKLHKFKSISKKGRISDVISQTVVALHIDLIVMGNKGKTGVKELFMGGNTLKVANTIDYCPILAIPKEIAYSQHQEIVFVTDFKKGCSDKTLEPLLFLAFLTNAEIVVLHIKHDPIMSADQLSNIKLLERCFAKIKYRFEEAEEYADKANVIRNFLAKNTMTMLAMAHHKKHFFERLFREPVIQDLSFYIKIPFLILPVKDC